MDAAGHLRQIFNPANLDPYRAKWPHIRWWACFMNHGVASIFTALQNDASARATLVAELGDVLDALPYLHGVDIDLERGGSDVAKAEALFRQIADGDTLRIGPERFDHTRRLDADDQRQLPLGVRHAAQAELEAQNQALREAHGLPRMPAGAAIRKQRARHAR